MSVEAYRRRGKNAAPQLDRLVRIVRGAAWMDSAACLSATVDLWYDAEHETQEAKVERVTAARYICERCPVRLECLETALHNVEPHGIWGGLTTSERYSLARAIEEIA